MANVLVPQPCGPKSASVRDPGGKDAHPPQPEPETSRRVLESHRTRRAAGIVQRVERTLDCTLNTLRVTRGQGLACGRLEALLLRPSRAETVGREFREFVLDERVHNRYLWFFEGS